MKHMNATLRALLVIGTLSFPGFAMATEGPEEAEGGTAYVVQPRRFRSGHEFRFATGYLPQDAFYKGTPAELSWSYHFSDLFSWEVIRGGYSWNHTTDLSSRLRDEFAVDNQPYQKAQYFLFSHARFSPLYGKTALFGRSLVHQEIYFVGGAGGIGWMHHENGRADTPVNFRPAVNVGMGFRWHLSDLVSLRLEALEDFYQKPNGQIDDQIYMTFGVSLSTKR